jgi:hypothetical protein
VPASENLSCSVAKPNSVVTGTINYACCDGDVNAPCLIGTANILAKPVVR